MYNDDLILAEDFCNNHQVTFSFIHSLYQIGLVEITSIEQNQYIPQSEIRRLEQLIRLHFDLEINLEGIDAIMNLLEKVQSLQAELSFTRNRLRLYEDLE
jgi:hypothetical protein